MSRLESCGSLSKLDGAGLQDRARGPGAYGGDAAGGSRGLERLGNGWRTKKEKGGIVVFVGKESGEAGGELWVSLS